MKVICDNCRAVYKIPDEKLVKPVNKATCRQCGHRMLIPRPRMDADPDERTLVTAVPPTPAPAPPRAEFNDDPPTNPMGRNPSNPSVRDSRDVELHTATPAPVQSASGTKPRGRRQPTETTQPPISAVSNAHDPATDMSIAFMGVLIALMGAGDADDAVRHRRLDDAQRQVPVLRGGHTGNHYVSEPDHRPLAVL